MFLSMVQGPHRIIGPEYDMIIEVEQVTVDTYAMPLYVISRTGQVFNWDHVYALLPVDGTTDMEKVWYKT